MQVLVVKEAEEGMSWREEEKRVQVLVVKEAENLEEGQQREETLHTCQDNMTEICEVSG